MLTLFSKIVLFISSYIPLYVIFGISILFEINFDFNKLSTFSIILLVIISLLIVGSTLLLLLILKIQEKATNQIPIINISTINKEITNYIFAYLLPFIGIDVSAPKDLTTFCLVFILIGYIYVKNSYFYVNPTLYFIGYSIYTFNNETKILISKRSIFALEREITLKNKLSNISNIGNLIYLDHNK